MDVMCVPSALSPPSHRHRGLFHTSCVLRMEQNVFAKIPSQDYTNLRDQWYSIIWPSNDVTLTSNDTFNINFKYPFACNMNQVQPSRR